MEGWNIIPPMYTFIVCQSWLSADLGLPGIRAVCLR